MIQYVKGREKCAYIHLLSLLDQMYVYAFDERMATMRYGVSLKTQSVFESLPFI